MRWGWSILVTAGLAAAAFCTDTAQPSTPQSPAPQTQGIPVFPCGQGEAATPGCNPSKQELKKAKAAFAEGLKLEKENRTQEAFDEFETAAQLTPRNVDYVTAREVIRQQVIYEDLDHGNTALLSGRQVEALADFRAALQLDPDNQFAQQRLNDALGEWAPKTSIATQVLEDAGELQLTPTAIHTDFHYRGDGRGLLTEVAKAFGITVTFDDSVVSRPIRFDLTDVDFYTAMRIASAVTQTFWTPLQAKQILIAKESTENHTKFDRMALRTFYLPGSPTAAELTNLVNLLRSLFDIKFITPQPRSGTISIRAPENLLDPATQFLESLDSSRPEVMLDVEVYEIDHTMMRNLGMQIPNQFQLFNIPAAALLALGGQNIQQLINQLISGGGINQANSSSIQSLLSQLEGQQGQSSIFSNPLATFGNGLTLMGLSLGSAGFQASLNESWVKNLQHVTLRVSQNNDATLRAGSRYPILNASFAPIFNSSAISQVLQNNSFRAPFPSFTYEDLGLTLKAKPYVNRGSDVSLQLDLQFRTLLAQSFNGVPVISNREFKCSLTLLDGQPAVVAGSLTQSEQRSMTGLPGLGLVPGLNQIMTGNSKQEEADELLITVTPHITNRNAPNQDSLVWIKQ